MASVETLTLSAAIVGATEGPTTQTVDARWLMAYAAGVGMDDDRYFDTTRAEGPLAHPLFAVCYEWPLAVALRQRAIGAAIAHLSVHAAHHLVIHRAVRAGDAVTTTARVVGIARRPAGVLVTTRFDTVDAQRRPITTTLHGSVYRGVTLDAETGEHVRPAEAGEGPSRWEAVLEISPHAAHVYTECARIWNPIHTDVAAARAAGLPRPILHGTATLALAVAQVVARDLDGESAGVREVTARFTGTVEMPSAITVRGLDRTAQRVGFDVVDPQGRNVLSRGAVTS
jgi:acyl dehydratase